MGQYHMVFNISKREYIHGHRIDNGLKLLEQCGPMSKPSTSDAVWLLLANSNGRGGGDSQDHPLIGRWAGDRLVVQGDYASKEDQAYISEKRMKQFTDISAQVVDMFRVAFE